MAKILVIDDEAAILNLMAKSCRQQGHEVTAVQTGREGIEALDRFKPEMMIVDLLIGDMTGLEIISYGAENHPRYASDHGNWKRFPLILRWKRCDWEPSTI